MALYILKCIEDYGYGAYDEKVIRARCDDEARKIANLDTVNEGSIWTDPTLVTCEPIDVLGESGPILESFTGG
jgi:hypothetical protein